MNDTPTRICVSGYTHVAAEDADELFEAARTMMGATHTEAGCIVYQMTQDLETPSKLWVYEEWASQEALAAHMNTDHMAVWRGVVEGCEVIARQITVFDGRNFRVI